MVRKEGTGLSKCISRSVRYISMTPKGSQYSTNNHYFLLLLLLEKKNNGFNPPFFFPQTHSTSKARGPQSKLSRSKVNL